MFVFRRSHATITLSPLTLTRAGFPSRLSVKAFRQQEQEIR
jgi:hypothetical protein